MSEDEISEVLQTQWEDTGNGIIPSKKEKKKPFWRWKSKNTSHSKKFKVHETDVEELSSESDVSLPKAKPKDQDNANTSVEFVPVDYTSTPMQMSEYTPGLVTNDDSDKPESMESFEDILPPSLDGQPVPQLPLHNLQSLSDEQVPPTEHRPPPISQIVPLEGSSSNQMAVETMTFSMENYPYDESEEEDDEEFDWDKFLAGENAAGLQKQHQGEEIEPEEQSTTDSEFTPPLPKVDLTAKPQKSALKKSSKKSSKKRSRLKKKRVSIGEEETIIGDIRRQSTTEKPAKKRTSFSDDESITDKKRTSFSDDDSTTDKKAKKRTSFSDDDIITDNSDDITIDNNETSGSNEDIEKQLTTDNNAKQRKSLSDDDYVTDDDLPDKSTAMPTSTPSNENVKTNEKKPKKQGFFQRKQTPFPMMEGEASQSIGRKQEKFKEKFKEKKTNKKSKKRESSYGTKHIDVFY